MGTNKIATVVIFDVCKRMEELSENGESYFERSLNCLKKIILRKMFSQDNDEMGIVLFGSDNTDNELAKGSLYQNISVFANVAHANWDVFKKVSKLNTSSIYKSEWIEALVVGIHFLKVETQGRRFKSKQIILFSNFSYETTANEHTVKPLINTLEGENIQLITVGNDMNKESDGMELDTELATSLRLIFDTVNKLQSGYHFSLSEIEKDLMYFEKKRKMGRLLKVNLSIGSMIQLPVRWMKVTNEETRFRWDLPPELFSKYNQGSSFYESKADKIELITDTVKTTNFGESLVELSYADCESLNRQTGCPSFTFMGTIKSSKISRSMFVSNDLYVVVPDKDARSVSMFSALVDSLIRNNRYGLARRIAVKNGKITVGALLPVSDDLGKAMYFLKLPYAEWVQKVPEKPLTEPDLEDGAKAVNDLIDAAMLPDDLVEEGKGLLVRDPTFQSRCNALYLRAVGELPERSIIDQPETVQKILNPVPLRDEAKDALQRLAQLFPYTPLPEPSSSHFKKKETIGKPVNNVKTANNGLTKKEIEDIVNLAEKEYDHVLSEEDMF